MRKKMEVVIEKSVDTLPTAVYIARLRQFGANKLQFNC